MSTDFRAVLEQWRDLADTDLLCPENPAKTDWGAVAAAIAATRAALAQSEGQSILNVNLKLDTSPECLKRLVDGLTKAVTPNGGYEAVSPNDSPFVTHGIQIVQGERWIPQYGCDSLENTLDAIKYKITCAVTDWFATAMVPAGSEQPEGEGLTNDEALRRGRSAIEAAPKSRNPTMDEVMDLARSFQLEVSDRDAGALMWLVITAIAVWGDASATPPAPEAGELGEVVEWLESQAAHLRKMQEIGALPETELQEMLDRAATLLQQQLSAPAPAVVPVAWCRSDEFANSMKRGGSFNGWKDPGAGTDKCDMQLYAIPLPQAGEVQS